MMIHTFNPSTKEAETDGYLEFQAIPSNGYKLRPGLNNNQKSKQNTQNYLADIETLLRNLPEWMLPMPGVSCGKNKIPDKL